MRGGWLSRRRHRMRQEEGSNGTTNLPDDALAAVFARFSDAADVARCYATCRRWARVAAAALARAQPPEIARGCALLGLFHQEDPGVTAPRKRKRTPFSGTTVASGQPCFVPTAAAIARGVVLRGVAYWPLRRSALAVRLDGPEPAEVSMPKDGIPSDRPQHCRLLGVTPDTKQRLCFVDARFHSDRGLQRAGLPFLSFILVTTILNAGDGDDDYDIAAGRWVMRRGCIRFPEIMVSDFHSINLRWFCEKSGAIFFTVGEDSRSSGAYAVNVATGEVERVAHGPGCDNWRNVVGYEMDAGGYLAYISCY
nr:unnamed protein product [Digitaria exilis]